MSALLTTHRGAPDAAHPRDVARRIAVVRAVLALAWAAALVVAVRHRVPSTHSDIPLAAAALLTTYPAIDAIASIVGASHGTTTSSALLLRVNAVISAVAVAALAVTAFGYDAGSALAAFGAWAAVSGAVQLATALRHRRTDRRQLPMIVSGGLSTLAGINFITAATSDAAHLATIAYYMAFGAVLYLAWALRRQTSRGPVDNTPATP
jgi:uncharacterized membrane protein HdeD (DUF308 family)